MKAATFFFLIALAVAAPLEPRGILDDFKNDLSIAKDAVEGTAQAVTANVATLDPSLLPNIDYFAEYSAAAYCGESNFVEGTQVTCSDNVSCPTVTANDVTTVLVFANTGDADTTGFVARDDTTKTIVVSFRGSRSIRNFIADADFVQVPVDNICSGCEVHQGFNDAYKDDATAIRAAVQAQAAANPDYQVVVTGHSLGAALAVIAATDLRGLGFDATLYTYGQPRVGNDKFSAFATNNGTIYRVTHLNDPVPRLPPIATGYVHISPEFWISEGDTDIPASAIDGPLAGAINLNGNTGDDILSFNVSAHLAYILPNGISNCGPVGLEF